MKILMTNHDLAQYGGTQTWVREMGQALRRKGHVIEVFTLVNGDFKVPFHVWEAQIPQPPYYDLALINHQMCMMALKPYLGCPTIYTQHGPTHVAELYPGGADAVVAVTEEVQGALAHRGFASQVITNGVNLDRFRPSSGAEYDVLNLCKGSRGSEMVSQACETLGLSCVTVNYKTGPVDDVPPVMRKARAVVAYGRGVREALACGKQVFTFDARGYEVPRGDGWLTPDNVDITALTGHSGRTRNKHFSQEELEDELRVLPELGEWGRIWAEQNANIDDKAEEYLELAAVLIEQKEVVA